MEAPVGCTGYVPRSGPFLGLLVRTRHPGQEKCEAVHSYSPKVPFSGQQRLMLNLLIFMGKRL